MTKFQVKIVLFLRCFFATIFLLSVNLGRLGEEVEIEADVLEFDPAPGSCTPTVM